MPIKSSKIHPSVKIFHKNLVNIYGCQIGKNTTIGPFIEIQKGVIIGKNCKISSHSFICSGVEIDDNVFIGHNVTFINDRYPKAVNEREKLKTKNDWKMEKIFIGKNSSIGSGSVLMCGIKIGSNVTIGANSFINKNIKNNKTFYNPRKQIIK